YFVQLSDGCLTVSSIGGNGVFRIYRETLSRFSCAASLGRRRRDQPIRGHGQGTDTAHVGVVAW
ncbi:hypothetical protein ABLN67_11565, partial [Mycobacterium tuberculosis]